MRELDRHAIEVCSVPSLVLMENAGANAASLLIAELEDPEAEIVVVAGPGNNGGDGFVVARHLLGESLRVEVFLLGDPARLKGDAKANHDAWRGLGGRTTVIADDAAVLALSARLERLTASDAVVDALYGTGLDRPLEGLSAAVVEALNAAPARRFALDIPSGLDANTGAVLGVAVRADTTVTFGHLKLGLLTPRGAELSGELHVVDIGVPGELHREIGHDAFVIEASDVGDLLAPRSVAAHKGSAGHVFAVAGSAGKTGAALLVARGALRGGAGLATICTFPDAADALDHRVLEEMTARIDPDDVGGSLERELARADVVAMGPGLGLDERARRVVEHVIGKRTGPVVVDADAISQFAGRAADLSRAAGSLILTPHPGELARLLGCSTEEVEADRFGALARAVELTRAVVLLKGARTLVGAPGQVPLVCMAGTPALATGGAGDVLTGMIAAYARVLEPRLAAIVGAFVHARAAERWAEAGGADRGLLAHEVADRVPEVAARLSGASPRMPPD